MVAHFISYHSVTDSTKMRVLNLYLLSVVFGHGNRFSNPRAYILTSKRMIPQGKG